MCEGVKITVHPLGDYVSRKNWSYNSQGVRALPARGVTFINWDVWQGRRIRNIDIVDDQIAPIIQNKTAYIFPVLGITASC